MRVLVTILLVIIVLCVGIAVLKITQPSPRERVSVSIPSAPAGRDVFATGVRTGLDIFNRRVQNGAKRIDIESIVGEALARFDNRKEKTEDK